MKQIYLHGLGQNPDSWSKVIEQLEAVEHSMCPDLSKLVQGQDTTYQNLYAAFSVMCDAIFRFVPKSMFQQMGFGKSDFLKLCNTMMELDFSNSIYKVSCPTLVIYGEKDRANQNASIELANMLVDAEVQVFSGAGHEINIEAPDKLVETLRVFFSRV